MVIWHMLNKQNKPVADTRAALEVVSSVAVVFKPFVIKIRYEDEVRRGLTSSRLNMVDCKFEQIIPTKTSLLPVQ